MLKKHKEQSAPKGPHIDLNIWGPDYEREIRQDRYVPTANQMHMRFVGDRRELELVKKEITQRKKRKVPCTYNPRTFTVIDDTGYPTPRGDTRREMHVFYETGRTSNHATISFVQSTMGALLGNDTPIFRKIPGRAVFGFLKFSRSNQWQCALGQVDAVPVNGQRGLMYVQTEDRGTILMSKRDFNVLFEQVASPKKTATKARSIHKSPVPN